MEKAIALAERGEFIKPEKCNTVQFFKNDELDIIYSTPFSGAEIYPGQPTYTVGIWFGGKKVIEIDYLSFRELEGKRKQLKPQV
ncbi:hypothetical protein [Neptunomonas sp.]|uniref:hypothetical protein n=1 Tax=Neptunomonas sp. TaxID=1971898 RepID=UPI003565A95E